MMATHTDNAPRHVPTHGGVESYFLRANHPTEPRAIWLKATVLVPDAGAPVAEAWVAVFDHDRAYAIKQTVPLARATFASGDTVRVAIAGCTFELGPTGGHVTGTLAHGDHATTWNLAYTAVPELSAPLCPYPSRRMIDGSFPKSKLLTPVPCARFSGTIDDEPVTDWFGMQGHNWGKSHAFEYAWGQCVFTAADGAPHALVEGFTGRIKLGPVITPRLSSLVVRRGAREYRFDRVFRPWRQTAELDGRKWTLRIRGEDGEAVLAMHADPARMVCLGYQNPDGALSYCLNSKLAKTVLRVNPVDGEGFECASAHGGALEFLVRTPDAAFPEVV
jgi:hypothetical protein